MKNNAQVGTVKDNSPITENEKCKESVLFTNGADTAVDMLVNAAAVTRFLIDMTPAMQMDAGELTETGFHGLYLILTGIENTISVATDMI